MKAWREFEELVARIEKAASPSSAVVTSPDRIPELRNEETLREVDASIRYKIGTANILITIECRKRSRKADVTWIEQLATKKTKIGAAKTIAVSSEGFTELARVTARELGIEVRTLSEVTPEHIEGWFLPGGAVHVCRLFEDVRGFVVLFEDDGEPSKYGNHLNSTEVEKGVFYNDWLASPHALIDYLPILERTHPHLFEGIPFDGTKVELELPIDWEHGQLRVVMKEGMRSVRFTKLILTASYESTVCDLDSGTHRQYSAPDGTDIQLSTFDTEWMGMPVTIEHQSDGTKGGVVRRKFQTKKPTKN
jgi:hypothetical protein